MAKVVQAQLSNAAVGMPIPVAKAIPLAQGFASVPAMALPADWDGTMTPEIYGVLANARAFTVRQHVKVLPKSCCSWPPCVKQENTYSIYAGVGDGNGNTETASELFRANEVSNDWNRCCCTPHHPLKVEMRQVIPDVSALAGNPDLADLRNDWERFTGKDRMEAEKAAYAKIPVSLTMVRDGTQFPMCCNKCVGCVACTPCCADGFTTIAGPTSEGNDQTELIGKALIDNLDPAKIIGSGEVPSGTACGGCFTPTLNLTQSSNNAPFAKLEGPCCFGGWSEMFCDFDFPISKFNSPGKLGDLAVVTKQKPNGLVAAAKEMMTDSDVYTIQFKDPNLDPQQKAVFLSALMLSDYTYFEQGGGDKCGVDENGDFYLNFCNMYCCGMLCPCRATCSNNS